MTSTKPDHGWAWVVAASSFGAHCISGYFQFASGMIHLVLSETFYGSLLKTSWISAIFLSLISLAGPVCSILINRFNCRISMVIGSLLLTTGLIATAFVPNINWVFLTYGLISGTGLGICYNAGLIVLGFNFDKQRNVACGFAISGSGIGPFVLTPIFQLVYETYGGSGFFLLLGGLSLQYCILGMTFKETEIERKIKRLQQNQNYFGNSRSCLEILRSIPMFCLCFGLFLADVSIYLLYVHFPEYCLQSNSTKTEVSLFMSLAGVCSAAGKCLFGLANNVENIDESIMLFGTFGVLSIVTILFPMYRFYFVTKVVYSSMLGCYSGCCWTVVTTLVVNILGHKNLAHGVGYLMVYCGLGTFLGPPIAGFIVDYGGTYGDSFTVAGVLLIVGAFLSLLSSACGGEIKQNYKPEVTELEINVKPESAHMLKDIKFNKEQITD